jgi:hypothetical protein
MSRIDSLQATASPVRDATGRIDLGGGVESLYRLTEPEGVKEGHRADELRLRGRVAGRVEIHGARHRRCLLGLHRKCEEEADHHCDRHQAHCFPSQY